MSVVWLTERASAASQVRSFRPIVFYLVWERRAEFGKSSDQVAHYQLLDINNGKLAEIGYVLSNFSLGLGATSSAEHYSPIMLV
ncbi:hypothetical protein CEXT_177351 [Caerostris extrusa]|uniref:Uncharacterized protein n=1 Tax=Caerostris extrusa TaxID=172846 RepID=A0AAV4N4E0_CAEEX|nr:hypothetical protein CEXT_177351 [Caerostris extrusa]